jgi:hypothetical protein
MRTHQYRFCPTCGTNRQTDRHHCVVCNEPLRLTPVAETAAVVEAKAPDIRARAVSMPGWHGLSWRQEAARRAA